MARMAESMLRALGGSEVRLLLAVVQPDDPAARRLGLKPSDVEEISCSPVVVRALNNSDGPAEYEVLFASSTLQRLAEAHGSLHPESLIQSALGVMYEHKRLRIESVRVEHFANCPYLYRISVAELARAV